LPRLFKVYRPDFSKGIVENLTTSKLDKNSSPDNRKLTY